MLNDGNIKLPVYDYLHYEKVFDDFERQRRMETLEMLNRYGESIVTIPILNFFLTPFSKNLTTLSTSMETDTLLINPSTLMKWSREGTFNTTDLLRA